MPRIHRFRAIRPADAAAVASPPYDVVTTDEARALAGPQSFLHVTRPEIDLPEGADAHGDEAYAKAHENFARFLAEGVLVEDEEPGIYLYRVGAQTGVVCCYAVIDYENDVIKRHERTRPDKEDDRTRHMLAIGAHPGPLFLTYRDRPEIARLLEHDTRGEPLFDFTAPDGVRHSGWRTSRARAYLDAFFGIEAYIADGHHRAAAAARVAKERGGEAGRALGVLFPASELTILAYNRVVADLNGLTPAEVRAGLFLEETGDKEPARTGLVSVYLDGAWFTLDLKPGADDLDCALLQENVLAPTFGIGDPRTDPRISFVGGARGTAALEAAVDAGEAAIAFSMYPTTIEQVMAVSDRGEVMPPKSTWFEPKLRSGLFVHAF